MTQSVLLNGFVNSMIVAALKKHGRVLNHQGPAYKGICGQRDLVAQTVIYDTASFFRHS